MMYQDIHAHLSEAFAKPETDTYLPELNLSIHHREFISDSAETFLPGSVDLTCSDHSLVFDTPTLLMPPDPNHLWSVNDAEIVANKHFKYTIIKSGKDASKGAILLLHGLNEKRWDKYLPWAESLARQTNKAVILFPIAFHMDRALAVWGNPKVMQQISEKRLNQDVLNTQSSFVNAAISSRMEAYPQRLFWSGLQTYHDIVKLRLQIASGEIPEISAQVKVDLFGYSIGTFLSLLLMMSNPKDLFSDSKFFCFCGGITLDRMNPISKYIMDANAAITLQKTFAQFMNVNFANDRHMAHYQEESLHPEESWFKTMLQYKHFLRQREDRLKEISHRINALLLVQDKVMPYIEALNTLKGGLRNIDVPVNVMDYPYPYSHIAPFPLQHKYAEQVNHSFEQTMKMAADFLGD